MNRRDFFRKAGLATAGALVSAEAIHDFMEWQNRRIFALGAVPGSIAPVRPREAWGVIDSTGISWVEFGWSAVTVRYEYESTGRVKATKYEAFHS